MKASIESPVYQTLLRSFVICLVWTTAGWLEANTWYVDNVKGADSYDGLSEERAFRTLDRAIKALKLSDSLSLANTGEVYCENLLISHLGGTPAKPMVIEGSFEASGLMLQSSSYVVVKNLTAEFYANDGFNVHGDCRSTVFENIEGRFNGDDGFSIHEAVEAVVRNGHFHHNGSGIEDVNLSRSFYSGIKVHDNSRLGILFIGAFHSAVDVEVYDNPSNFRITPGVTKHLLGGEFSPIRGTSVYLQNVISHGGGTGLFASDRARVMVVSSVFSGSKKGLVVRKGSRVHLTKSVVADCGELELQIKGGEFFGEATIYFPGRYEVGDETFSPEQWQDFKAVVGHHEESLQQNPKLDGQYQIGEASLKRLGRHLIGPTAFYGGQ